MTIQACYGCLTKKTLQVNELKRNGLTRLSASLIHFQGFALCLYLREAVAIELADINATSMPTPHMLIEFVAGCGGSVGSSQVRVGSGGWLSVGEIVGVGLGVGVNVGVGFAVGDADGDVVGAVGVGVIVGVGAAVGVGDGVGVTVGDGVGLGVGVGVAVGVGVGEGVCL